MKMRALFFLTLIIFISYLQNVICLPTKIDKRSIANNNVFNQNSIHKQNTKSNQKKDVFISRGWGAGGMPFSVLYMSPVSSSKAPLQVEEPYKTLPSISLQQVEPRPKALPQVRNSIVNSGGNRRMSGSYSAIPQLFVSYGWGPLGK